jgi:PAS domain S-box-containing protein
MVGIIARSILVKSIIYVINMVQFPYDRRPGPGQQGLGGTRHLWIAVAALAAIFLSHPIAAAPTKEVRRILILNEVGTSYPAIPIINEGIQAALNDSPYRLEFYSEYMDTVLFPDPADQQEFRDFYLRKYQNRKPDVIITVGPSPLKFMEEVHQRAFPGVPLVFCLPTIGVPGAPALDSDFTGVENDMAPAKTLETALRLQPGTEHVVVVNGGISEYDRHQLANVKAELNAFTGHLDITYMTGLAMSDLLERLGHLPPHAVVLLTSIGQDATGARFTSRDIGPMVAVAANAPVFSLFDVYLNHGEVGGYLSSLSEQGKVAGYMALKLLSGAKPQDIPRVKGVNTYMFDWRALQRWGLKVSELPRESIVLNYQPTVWESYKSYIIGGISLIIVETLLIFGLVWQRARRREAEIQLANSFETVQESERRFRLVANSAPVMIWMSGPDRLCNYFNQPWLDFTGRSLEAELGNGWSEGIHPDDLKDCLDIYMRAFDLRESFKMQYRLRRHDGVYRWVSDIGVPRLNLDGSLAGYIGSCLDVTDHRLAEDALSQMGRRLIEAHEEERTWIARELHDDINQRIALLALQLEQGYPGPPSSDVEVPDHITQVCQQLFDLGKDVHALSHRLHSSQLETLGIVSAARGFCRELSEQKKVEIEFIDEGISPSLPNEISLCLFRVLQEALQNAVKYSGERHFRVELGGSSEEIQLTVRDSGIGFDQRDAIERHGLGLISMRERLHLVGGELSIQSEPSRGTTISARVPLEVKKTKTSVASAAG